MTISFSFLSGKSEPILVELVVVDIIFFRKIEGLELQQTKSKPLMPTLYMSGSDPTDHVYGFDFRIALIFASVWFSHPGTKCEKRCAEMRKVGIRVNQLL